MQIDEIKIHDAEATLFSSAARLLGSAGFTELKFDIGGKKSRRRYISALSKSGEEIKIWVKSARTWPGKADAILFPWKKYKEAHSGYHSVLFSCESAKYKGVTHLLAVAGDEQTGQLYFAQLYSIDEIPELVFRQSEAVENRFYSAHSSSLVISSYAPEFDEAAKFSVNSGNDILSCKSDKYFESTSSALEEKIVRRSGRAYKRDRKTREAILSLAQGVCECCGELGFETDDGSRYLETHHIIEVSAHGPDDMTNVVAVCPNCHRKAHYSKSRLSVERAMITAIRQRGSKNA